MVVATDILNLWMHAADEVGAGFAALERDHPGRTRLIDHVVAWGDEATIAARVHAHFDAGADHVCVQA